MQTDEMIRIPRPQHDTAGARALQQLTPLSCHVVNSRRKRVPLTSAGYVLRFGQTYYLQVVPPFSDPELEHVRIVNVPEFIAEDEEVLEVDADGQPVRSIPFRVLSGWSSFWSRFGLDVRSDYLDVGYRFQKGREKEVGPYRCPVIVTRRLGLGVVFAAVIGTALALLQHLASEVVLNGRLPEGGLNGLAIRFVRHPFSWLLFIGLSLLLLAGAFSVQCWTVHRRSRHLKREFRDRYPEGVARKL